MHASGLIDIQQEPDANVMEALCEARRRLSAQWLSLPQGDLRIHWAGQLGRIHRSLVAVGIRDQLPTQWDGPLRQQLTAAFTQPHGVEPGVILAAILFFYPHELGSFAPLEQIPDWLGEHYLWFMQAAPPMFRTAGEADAYARFTARWLQYLQERLASRVGNNRWARIGEFALQSIVVLMAYFNNDNLRELMTCRARILEQTLAAMGNTLDYQFAARPESRKIRVGILADHFTPQTETFATLPVYRYLDRSKFEIVLFCVNVRDHPLQKWCERLADRFVPLPPQLGQQVGVIRAADIDLLFLGTNVTAVTNQVTLLATHRLARVQVAGVCSCITTGMRNVDWYLSGTLSESSEDAQTHYSERLMMIEGPAHCYDFGTESIADTLPPVTRQEVGIEENAVVFASGANFFKILPELDDIWAQILSQVPGSRLLLYPFNQNWAESYLERPFLRRVSTALMRRGVSPERLLVFSSAPSRAQVLQRLALGDIYLDSFPFAGATSLLDPLQIGIPVIAMRGNNFRSLVGAGLMRDLQLDDLIAVDRQSYVQLAVKLGLDRAERDLARRRVVDAMKRGPRFLDSRWYGEQVGFAFSKIWDTYCRERR